VGRKEQSDAVAADEIIAQEAAKFGGRERVQTASRLIQQKDARAMEHGARQAQSLHGSGGEQAHLAIQRWRETEAIGDFGDAELRILRRKIAELGEELQILERRQAGIKTGLRSAVESQGVADTIRLVDNVPAIHFRMATGGQQKRGQDSQKRGFAGAVGSDDGERFAGRNLESDRSESSVGGASEGSEERPPAGLGRRKKFFDQLDADSIGSHDAQLYRNSAGGI
jgi:hypothetical protein